MAKIYFNRLYTKAINFTEIPNQFKIAVKEIGEDWLRKGKISETFYNELFG